MFLDTQIWLPGLIIQFLRKKGEATEKGFHNHPQMHFLKIILITF